MVDEYCSFTKAIEHLGERWTLLIVRALLVNGAQGFSELAIGLPGRISRSVLADRLRRLDDFGLVSRSAGRYGRYRLTDAGAGLAPAILALRRWADDWLPDDPGMAARDPAILLAWLGERVEPTELPERPVVLEITVRLEPEFRGWLVLRRDAEPYGCAVDPMLAESRYLYLEAGPPVMVGLARGSRAWGPALADGSLHADGDPGLLHALPSWFRRAGADAGMTGDAQREPDPPGPPPRMTAAGIDPARPASDPASHARGAVWQRGPVVPGRRRG